jgi:hypothetical protein
MFTELAISAFMNSFERLIDSQTNIDLMTALNISLNGSSRKFVIDFKRFDTGGASSGNAGGANGSVVSAIFSPSPRGISC